MKREKDLTEKAEKKELRGYYYASVHQYEGECDEDKFVDIVCCDQYGVSYESCYDGWDYIIRKVPNYEDVCGMESQIKRLQEQIKEANKIIIKRMNQDLDWEGGFDEDCVNYADKYGIELIEGKWGVK